MLGRARAGREVRDAGQGPLPVSPLAKWSVSDAVKPASFRSEVWVLPYTGPCLFDIPVTQDVFLELPLSTPSHICIPCIWQVDCLDMAI